MGSTPQKKQRVIESSRRVDSIPNATITSEGKSVSGKSSVPSARFPSVAEADFYAFLDLWKTRRKEWVGGVVDAFT